jgi:hypothetical protein
MVDAKWGKKTIRWLHANGGQGSRHRETCVEDGGCEVGLGVTVRVNFVKGRCVPAPQTVCLSFFFQHMCKRIREREKEF